MKKEYVINPCCGIKIPVSKGETVTVIDVEGGQVADFFAVNKNNPEEFLSTAVTIDANDSLKLGVGDKIYSNIYNPMFTVLYDDVKEHDLIHPSCRKEMYDFFYQNGKGHPNCLDNINGALNEKRPIIIPVNLFMYTEILPNGKIEIKEPLSKPGDKIVMLAEEDVDLGVAACSVSESKCNAGKCTSLKIIVE